MARFSSFLIFFSILLTIVSTSVSQTDGESSQPLSQTVVDSKIAIGSSISASAGAGVSSSSTISSFWLSSSGLFSFGFYPLNTFYHQDYIIGIWINSNPTRKTLVWSINRDYSPLSNATTLLLNHDGKFVIQFSNGTKEKPLFHQADSLLSSPVSYASILDNGNLVFYNSNSTIIWESFAYPTDTILPGQTLHPKQSLVSSVSKSDRSSGKYTMIMKNDGSLMIYSLTSDPDDHIQLNTEWTSKTKKKNGSPVELKLDSTGHLYLSDWNGLIRKNLNKGNSSIDKGGEQDKVIYRATLGNDGVFRLYKEKIDENNASTKEKKIHTVVVWDTKEKNSNTIIIVALVASGLMIIAFFVFLYCMYNKTEKMLRGSSLSY